MVGVAKGTVDERFRDDGGAAQVRTVAMEDVGELAQRAQHPQVGVVDVREVVVAAFDRADEA